MMVRKTNPMPDRNAFGIKEKSSDLAPLSISLERYRIRYPNARIMHVMKKSSQAAAERILTKAKKLMGLSSMLWRLSMVRVVTYVTNGMKNLLMKT